MLGIFVIGMIGKVCGREIEHIGKFLGKVEPGWLVAAQLPPDFQRLLYPLIRLFGLSSAYRQVGQPFEGD